MPRRKGQAVIEKLNERLERLQITYVPLDSIQPNEYNPNRQNEHEFKLLCSSIREDGFTDPVKVVARDGLMVIVDGEHRWRAAREVGLDEIPVVVLPMGEAQAKIATLRHNRARGSEDIELATDVLRDLEALGALDWAADSLDLDDTELQRLLADIPSPEALAADEFSEAWVPGGQQGDGNTPGLVASSTPAAQTTAREREDAMRTARTEEERVIAARERQVFRLHLSFSGDEAEVVRAALGDTPAETILAWCRDAHARSAALDGADD